MAENYSFRTGPALPGSGRQQYESGVTKQLLYGHDIHKTPVPEHTAAGSPEPVVVFQNSTGTARFGLTEEMLSKHLLMLGGVGSGKTNTFYFLLRSLLSKLSNSDLVLIFDSKGDFYAKFYDPWNPNHLVVGNDPAYANSTCCWNIFDELRNEQGKFDKTSELAAKEIAKTLFAGRESSTQPFFFLAATDVVAKVLIHFFRHFPDRLTNANLVQFFRTANAKVYHEMIDQNPDFESARDYFGNRNANLTPQALGVLSYITTMVNDIFVGIFGENSPRGAFSMRQLVRQKGRKVVFIEYDLNAGEVLGPVYGLLYDLALKQALGGRKHTGNTYLICDEFRILPKLNHINDALNLGRSLGVKVVAGLQTINQLYDVYGPELGKTLAAGFMNSFCFVTWDLDSREFISGRFGGNYTNLHFHAGDTAVSAQREGHTVEDWDILNLRVGEAFVNLSGQVPFRFYFQRYQ